MSTSNLTAKYRPQTFAEVAGQEAIKTILSRAAAQDKIAPAYLFSGTRGVGKTTIARIFAKALNCVDAPTAEPCNKCQHCKQITAGVAPDVIEIDGASNRGIDDARRLKEDIGYAPIECRYKVFIIDEAHMLTKEAFNALLKTLEEPPPRATFIMATTEPHKFPATIVSRCQHYIYKMLPQQELEAHLRKIMNLEGLEYEEGALSIIAKRGAGSVRDSMSLLGQTLAMGNNLLSADTVRTFLGLAGQDIFFELMEAIHGRDLVGVSQTLRQIMDQGLDLGFFLRELTGCWRNMFLLRQAGESALPLLGLSGEEAKAWMDWAKKFEPVYIHACWQMTLEGQKRVMTSLEPALALELLLFNITSLPDLLNLESLGRMVPPPAAQSGGPGRPGPSGGMNNGPGRPAPGGYPSRQAQAQPPRQFNQPGQPAPAMAREPQAPPRTAPPMPQATPPATNQPPQPHPGAPAQQVQPSEEEPSQPTPSRPLATGPRDWEGFLGHVEKRNGTGGTAIPMLRLAKGEFEGDTLHIRCMSQVQCNQLSEKMVLDRLVVLAMEFFGPDMDIQVGVAERAVAKTARQLQQEAERHSGVQLIMESFDAQMVSVNPRKGQ